MRISVLGLGYIGLPTAIVLAKAGHQVFGFDVNGNAIETLNSGKIHIVEDNLQQAYEEALSTGYFHAYDELHEADVYIVAVPTPFKEGTEKKIANLDYIDSATAMVANLLKEGDLVILESTSPPMTTRRMTDKLCEMSGLSRDVFHTVHCPERVLPGRILYELEHNDRIMGAERKESAEIAKELYESFVKEGNIYITDDITAEMAKLVENSYRDVNIAFANELSIISDDLGIDVRELIALANKHPRVNILSPGVGVGGHCISVDPWFIVEKFNNAHIIQTAREVNDYKPMWIAGDIDKRLGGDKKKVIGILGLAYKPNIDDLRESPSIVLANILQRKGYKVLGCEPNTNCDVVNGIPIKSLDYVMDHCDLVVLAQRHKEFEEFNVEKGTNSKIYEC